MAVPITILHLTDIHIRGKHADDVKRRVNAFIKFATAKALKPDIVVVTGDIAFSGAKGEYELFEKIVLLPLANCLHVQPKHFILIPGNHDVERDLVTAPQNELARSLSQTRDAENLLLKERSPRLKNFFSFAQSFFPGAGSSIVTSQISAENAHTRLFSIRGIRVGVAALNSAWLCVDDNDKNHLFLTERQVSDAVETLKSAHLRIALCHHPFDWYHSAEAKLSLGDLARTFDVILTGHLHQPESEYQLTPSSETLVFTGRAFFDGKIREQVEDGFHVYEADIAQRRLVARYFKYVRKRDVFAKDTDHADEGEFPFNLPLSRSLFPSHSLAIQRLADTGNELQQEIRQELSILQGTTNPVIVTPKLFPFTLSKGKRILDRRAVALSDLLKANAIVFGPADSGKSILLKSLASEENTNSSLEDNGDAVPACLYLSLSRIPKPITSATIIDVIVKLTGVTGGEGDLPLLRLIVDDIRSDTEATVAMIQELCGQKGWSFLLALSGVFVAETLAQAESCKHINFYAIQP